MKKINKGIPETIAYKDHSISSIDYIAEEEQFKIVMDVGFLNSNNSKKVNRKTYYVKVPRDKAKSFKQNKSLYKYFYYLGDLQAIIAQDTTYSIEPIYTWYTKIACDKQKEDAVLLLEGNPNSESIENHLRSILNKHKDFEEMNSKTTPEYGEGFAEDYKKIRVSVYFTEEGHLSGCEVDYPFKHSKYGLLYNTYTNKETLKTLGNLITSIIEDSSVKIIPEKQQCEPVKSSIVFFHQPGK